MAKFLQLRAGMTNFGFLGRHSFLQQIVIQEVYIATQKLLPVSNRYFTAMDHIRWALQTNVLFHDAFHKPT